MSWISDPTLWLTVAIVAGMGGIGYLVTHRG